MGWVSGLAIYFIVWWTVLFLVLPWGVQPLPAEDVAKGHSAGAPRHPRMWLKLAVTSLLAFVVWLGVYAIIVSGVVSFRE